MQNEKIGAVTLDYRFYPGEDKYSDGGIEDEMLELAKTADPEEFDRIIAERENWPILYHFSHVRENILDWFPMTGEERVLEIGSGPGAITGVLARKAKEVTCVDLSRRRCLINAYRHRNCENVRILVGNFQDVASSLGETFDVITLIGVFEYAQFSIQSKDPFADYLKTIRQLLAPGGRLVIAIENRLGLKYWAGATEDHTGVYFEGLEGYPTTNYVRTFSRPELEQLFQRAGLNDFEFYYPYPDYKLPERIYSDAYLPKAGELTRNRQNLDRERVQIFSEERVYDSLAGSGLYPLYSNSFFAVVRKEEVPQKETECLLFSKYSNERAASYRIRTDILENGQAERLVRKCAVHPQAMEHIASLARKEQMLRADLEGTGLGVNRCRLSDGAAYLEWLEGNSLEEELDRLLEEAGDARSEIPAVFRERIHAFFALLEQGACAFHPTPEFDRVFGAASFKETELSRSVTNIDMIFANILHTQQGYQMIDYEWTFAFPVPVKFLKYRCLHYYVRGNSRRMDVLDEDQLYALAGISGDEIRQFAQMELHFQEYILGGYQPIWKLYDVISEGVIPAGELIREASSRKKQREVDVFFDRGTGYTADNSRTYRTDGEKRTRISIHIPGGTKALRIDPCRCRCIVRVELLEQGGRALEFQTNGKKNGNGDYIFDTEDPQILISGLSDGGGDVTVIFRAESMEGLVRDAVLAQSPLVQRLVRSKVWKGIRKGRDLLRK